MFGFPRKKLAEAPKLSDGDLKKLARRKPAQATIISRTTASRLQYLIERRLATFAGSNLKVATAFYRDMTGKLQKLPKGIPHGGV